LLLSGSNFGASLLLELEPPGADPHAGWCGEGGQQ
jgi:hypothetical protein